MNKRKQKLEVKSEEMISAEPDPPVAGPPGGNTEWFFENENTSLDLTSSLLNDDFLNLLDFPISLDDGPLSQEKFQDLKYTSTPKSRPPPERSLHDSGIEESCSKRKLKNNVSRNVLYDITEKIDSSCNNSFINISNLSETNSSDISFKRHVSIIRKDIVSKPQPQEKSKSGSISKEELVYYSGIKDFNKAIALIKHLKLPKSEFSSFKIQLITLMKMRLNLQWKDLSFRFSIPDSTVSAMTLKTIDIMSICFEELLPWHLQRKIIRKSLKCFYVQALFCEATSTQVLILVVESKKPVLFVSESFTLDISPLFMLNKCAKHLIPGDILCLNDISGNLSYYKVDHSNTTVGINYLQESTFTHCTFVENCQKIIGSILTDFSVLSHPENNMDLSRLLIIAGALTNINSADELTSSQLQKIYQKSYHISNPENNLTH